MFFPKSFAAVFMVWGAAATAGPLAEMAGDWRGSGWAKETLEGPQEATRCQITNDYDVATATLTLSGQCVVPGRRLSVAGTLTAAEGTGRITGSWSNPDGIGRAAVVGIERDNIVAFNFNVFDPVTAQTVAQNVEWRVDDNALRLRSTDRRNPDIMMSDIAFSRP